ncbi:MAG TPA: FkbM family methyltransferase [Bryobacteraceae bacterium]|nr:FkbM family methyltransferase [Bryobacteraceae bacterium]
MKPKVLLFAIIAIFPAFALINVFQAHHTGLVLSHYFGGRAGNCTLAESFEAERLSRLQFQNVEEIKKASRVVRKDELYSLWSTPAGEYWMPSASGNALIYDLGEQKRDIYGTNMHAGDIVLDAGANVGVFTRKALAFGAAKVIAIEPAPENLECLRRSFAAEIADGRVVLYPKGVWDKDDVLKLSVDPGDSAKDTFVRPIEHAQFIEVGLTTIDKLVEELHLPKVDFIKMDIEGAEQKAVVGAKNTIAKYRPRMALCIYHIKGDETKVPQLVHDIVSDYKVRKTCLCAQDRVQPEVAFFN